MAVAWTGARFGPIGSTNPDKDSGSGCHAAGRAAVPPRGSSVGMTGFAQLDDSGFDIPDDGVRGPDP
jgi:hypothetical protein